MLQRAGASDCTAGTLLTDAVTGVITWSDVLYRIHGYQRGEVLRADPGSRPSHRPLTAHWSPSGYMGAFGRAANRVFEIDEGRPFLKLRATMPAVTVVNLLIVVVLAAMLVLSGPVAESVGNIIGLGGLS